MAYDPNVSTDPLASRLSRLGAAMIDGILLMLLVMPVQFLTGFMQRAQTQSAGILEQLAMSLFGMLAFLVLNGYLLAHRGQTIGKYLAKIQIVDYASSQKLPLFRVYVLRYLWTLPLVLLVVLIPGSVDDLLFNLVVLVDVLLIFGSERRCLHDLIAGSKVVMFQPDRPALVSQ